MFSTCVTSCRQDLELAEFILCRGAQPLQKYMKLSCLMHNSLVLHNAVDDVNYQTAYLVDYFIVIWACVWPASLFESADNRRMINYFVMDSIRTTQWTQYEWQEILFID